MEQVKTCGKCERILSVSEFSKCRSHRDGLQSICKACTKKYGTKRYQDNKREILASCASYRDKNRDKITQIKRAYYLANSEKIKVLVREYQRSNRAKVRSTKRLWLDKNRESVNARSRAWRLANPETAKQIRQRNYQKYKTEKLAYGARWRNNNKPLTKFYDQRERDRLSDSYVKKLINTYAGVQRDKITHAHIDAMRLQLTIQRLIKEKRKCQSQSQ